MDQWLAASVAPCRFEGLLQSLFSLATLLLAAVGLYGLVAHAVTCRTREIGVRMALGAGGSEVALMVPTGRAPDRARPRSRPPLSLGLTLFLGVVLLGIRPHDPATFALMTTLLASALPARRADAIHPAVALRSD